MGQTCRVCGVKVPSGFTNCDGCYGKMMEADAEEIKLTKHVSKRGRPEAVLRRTQSRLTNHRQFRII